MYNRHIIDSSFLFVRGYTSTILQMWKYLVQFILWELVPLSCHSTNRYLFIRDFTSAKEVSSSEMSPSWASLAVESAAEFPLMPTWPGTQIKTVSLPSLVSSNYASKSCTKIGWSYFRLNIACSDEWYTF